SASRSFTDAEYVLMTTMSLAARRPVNWNLLTIRAGAEEPAMRASRLGASNHAAAAGGRVLALTLPIPFGSRLNFLTGDIYELIPSWHELVFRLPPTERIVALRDPACRRLLREAAERHPMDPITDWAASVLGDAASAELRSLVGRRIGDI